MDDIYKAAVSAPPGALGWGGGSEMHLRIFVGSEMDLRIFVVGSPKLQWQ